MISASTPPLWTDVAAAWASIATVGLLLVAGCIALWQASEARNLRRAQSRPFVVIDFEAQSIRPFIYLRIANVGTTMARNVRFEFTPELASTFDSDGKLPATRELPILRDGIRSLPPGKEIRFLFDAAPQRTNARLPVSYDVTIRYEGEDLKHLIRRDEREQFEDEIALDLSIYMNLTHVTRRGEHDIHERIKEIGEVLKGWSASGGGLLALSREDVRNRDEEWFARQRERAEERRREAGGSDA